MMVAFSANNEETKDAARRCLASRHGQWHTKTIPLNKCQLTGSRHLLGEMLLVFLLFLRAGRNSFGTIGLSLKQHYRMHCACGASLDKVRKASVV